jgi:hypothetical protein
VAARLLIIGLLFVPGLAACDIGGDDGAARGAGASSPVVTAAPIDLDAAPVIRCADRHETAIPFAGPSDGDLTVGPLVLTGAAELATANPSELTPAVGRRWRHDKIGIAIAAGSRATLAVEPEDRASLGLLFVRRRPPASEPFSVRNGGAAVTFVACPASEPRFSTDDMNVGPWTEFGGELLIAEPGCYRLRVQVAGRTEAYVTQLQLGAGMCASTSASSSGR